MSDTKNAGRAMKKPKKKPNGGGNYGGSGVLDEIIRADAVRFPAEPPEHPAKPHARWALELYRECQRDAEADPWHEPGGAERRFIAKLHEYAGAE